MKVGQVPILNERSKDDRCGEAFELSKTLDSENIRTFESLLFSLEFRSSCTDSISFVTASPLPRLKSRMPRLTAASAAVFQDLAFNNRTAILFV